MGVDDDVRHDALDGERQVLLAVGQAAGPLLPMPGRQHSVAQRHQGEGLLACFPKKTSDPKFCITGNLDVARDPFEKKTHTCHKQLNGRHLVANLRRADTANLHLHEPVVLRVVGDHHLCAMQPQ